MKRVIKLKKLKDFILDNLNIVFPTMLITMLMIGIILLGVSIALNCWWIVLFWLPVILGFLILFIFIDEWRVEQYYDDDGK